MAAADFNLDGHVDLAITSGTVSSGSVSIRLGNGDGTLGSPTSFATGADPVALAVGDFDFDGDPDLATADRSPDKVSVLTNTG
jgi:hypothetical protein